MTLSELIHALSVGRNIHISIHDISGVLTLDQMKLDVAHRIHYTPFCDAAKGGHSGYERCISHKQRVNELAIERGAPFWGMCPYGICEVVWPVMMDGKTICIIYVGNLVEKREVSINRITACCKNTGAHTKQLLRELDNCQQGRCEDYLFTAQIIDGYIRTEVVSVPKSDSSTHWAVKQAKLYAKQYYDKPIHIGQVAGLCNLNSKYLGRVFKEQTGLSFGAYVNKLRTQQAACLLTQGDEQRITDIALICGYDDIAYFNRVFKAHYGCSPREYRRVGNK